MSNSKVILLADVIVKVTGVQKPIVEDYMNKVIEEMLIELSGYKEIYIPHLGHFLPKIVSEKIHRIGATGKDKIHPPKVTTRFKISQRFLNRLKNLKLKNIEMN